MVRRVKTRRWANCEKLNVLGINGASLGARRPSSTELERRPYSPALLWPLWMGRLRNTLRRTVDSTHSTDFDVYTMDTMSSASSQTSLRRLLSIDWPSLCEDSRALQAQHDDCSHNMMTAADRTDCSTFKELFEEFSEISTGYIGSCLVSDWLVEWGIVKENLRDL